MINWELHRDNNHDDTMTFLTKYLIKKLIKIISRQLNGHARCQLIKYLPFKLFLLN